ncbi:MAG: arginine deiminase family protein [Cytophagales bacterium]|nr:arginine deiminase family protein [Cytophagales bacterium]
MEFYLKDETAPLESVVLGIGVNRGAARAINPTIRKHLQNNSAPTEEAIIREIKTFEEVLVQNGVQVLRPEDLSGTEQIFTRDIGFVIEDYYFVANMKHAVRQEEIQGVDYILQQADSSKIVHLPEGALAEGGDVLLHGDYLFVGISDRTNHAGAAFLQEFFPGKTVVPLDLVVDQNDSDRNILHLDCTFQPIGKDQAIFYREGFLKRPDILLDMFPEERRIDVDQREKNLMFPNVFSISPAKVVIERNFHRLKEELQKRDFEVFEVDYAETSKLSGLLRCSTMPLRRSK